MISDRTTATSTLTFIFYECLKNGISGKVSIGWFGSVRLVLMTFLTSYNVKKCKSIRN